MKPFLLVAVLGLTGCAAGSDCGSDWGAVGERDGRMNFGYQAERYAARCSTKVDTAAYDEGFRRGTALRPPPNW
jgi:hypothetical protein